MYKILFLYEERLRSACKLHSNTLRVHFECQYSQFESDAVIGKIKADNYDLVVAYLQDITTEHKKELSKILTSSSNTHFMLCGTREELHKFHVLCGDKVDKYLLSSINVNDFIEVTKQLLDGINGIVQPDAPKINIEEFVDMRSILVVDDSPVSLRMVANWLKNDYIIAVAKSGKAALYYLEEEIPDVILLDYEMPEMSGVQTFEAIRSDSRFENVPVIFLTAVSEMDMVKEAIKFKPDGYVLKSAGITPLEEKIREALSKHGKI